MPSLKTLTRSLYFALCIATGLFSCGFIQAATPTDSELRILFIGNSYTGGVRKCLQQTFADTTELQFITKGGATLSDHLKQPTTIEIIQTGNWNFVVLQEQSQTPALSTDSAASFQQSVRTLSKIIQQAGASPILYATWGRRDGDQRNPKVFPDFETMNDQLSSAYQRAGSAATARVAPVGTAWAQLKQQDEALWRSLYAQDGSHPSTNGAYLTACVFAELFNQDTDHMTAELPLQQQHLFKAAAKAAVQSSK